MTWSQVLETAKSGRAGSPTWSSRNHFVKGLCTFFHISPRDPGISAGDAQACRAYGGLIDGLVDPVPPSQIQIDGN